MAVKSFMTPKDCAIKVVQEWSALNKANDMQALTDYIEAAITASLEADRERIELATILWAVSL